jgi:hypothetical protein
MARDLERTTKTSHLPVISQAFAPAVTRQLDRMAYIKILTAAADYVAAGLHGDAGEAIVQIAREHEWRMGQLPTRTGPAADALVFLCASSLALVLDVQKSARKRLVRQIDDAFETIPNADWGLIARVKEILR